MDNTTPQQERLDAIQERLHRYGRDRVVSAPLALVAMRQELSKRVRLPERGARTRGMNPWGDLVDFEEGASPAVKRRAEAEADIVNNYHGIHGVISPEYEMTEPWTILDTESYMLRAVTRKHSLMFRNGFAFTSTRANLTDYASNRAKQIAFVTRRSWENFLKETLRHLLVCSNAFWVKIRDEDASGGKRSERNRDRTPVAGYELVPAHVMYPYMDGKGRVEKWRRYFGGGREWKDYPVHDVIHWFWDRKPGHIFGTPRVTTVRDDIFALRRIEENAELLLLSYMFPFTHIKIGTEEAPCQYTPDGPSEIDLYRSYVQEMPKEGFLITDERVAVDIHDSKGGVDSAPLRDHYKNRIYIGFGVSPIDMGESDEATRSSADNVSQNLKDEVKADLRWFCEQFKYEVLLEWFQEAPFKVSVQNAVAEVNLEFNELDPDSQIKMESHHLNMFNNHAITHPELRQRIKHRAFNEEDEPQTHFRRHVMSLEEHRSKTQKDLLRMKAGFDVTLANVQAKAAEKTAKAETKLTEAKARLEEKKAKTQATKNAAPAKPAVKKSSGGKSISSGRSSRANPMKKAAPKAKVASTITQPRNQHGVNLDPHKTKSSLEFPMIHDTLLAAFRGLEAHENWGDKCAETLRLIPELSEEQRAEIGAYVSRATDEDLLFVYLKSALN